MSDPNRFSKKLNLFEILLFSLNISLRIFLAYVKPLWLDEKYSIYFANQFSFGQLLFQFSHDVHPGLFYALLKALLLVCNTEFIIRLLLTTVPQIAGIILLFFTINKKNKIWRSFFLLFMLNPFFLNLSWQLRMYSIVFLCSSVLVFVFEKRLKTKKKDLIFPLILTLFIGNYIHYSFFFISFSCLFFFAIEKKEKIFNRLSFFFLGSLLLIVQFFIISGAHSKKQFEEASWIHYPNLSNIITLYSTIAGMFNDNQNQSSVIPYILVLKLFLLSFVISIIFFHKFGNISFTSYIKSISVKIFQQPLLFMGVSQFFLILLLSFSFPFFSNRRFFYHFTPNLSVFLARTHVSGALLLSWLLSKTLSKISNIFLPLFFLLLIISLFWFETTFSYIKQVEQDKKKSLALTVQLEKNLFDKSVLIWPHWIWLELITTENSSLIEQIKQKTQDSESLSNLYYLGNKTSKESVICRSVSTKKILIQIDDGAPLQKDKNDFERIISKCCHTQSKDVDTFIEYNCNM